MVEHVEWDPALVVGKFPTMTWSASDVLVDEAPIPCMQIIIAF